jgi:hypothetical protein
VPRRDGSDEHLFKQGICLSGCQMPPPQCVSAPTKYPKYIYLPDRYSKALRMAIRGSESILEPIALHVIT